MPMGIKTLYQEVVEAMGKDAVDDEVVDRASDILKMLKAKEFASSLGLKEYSLHIQLKSMKDGTHDLYDKVLLGRRR